MIEEVFADAKERMTKAVEAAKESFATVRTGRANPALLQNLMVDYYGTPTPLPQLASVANQDARSLIITPYDKGAMKAIEQAIRDMHNLGANPTNDGNVIRVHPARADAGTPQGVREDREVRARRTLALPYATSAAARRTISTHSRARSARTTSLACEKELETLTKQFTDQVDDAFKRKEAELLEV